MSNPHTQKVAEYSTDSLVTILRALLVKKSHDKFDHQRINAIKALLKKRGVSIL